MMSKRREKSVRIVHVECEGPAGYRWLRQHARGATVLAQGEGFAVTDEGLWAQYLAMAGGKEIK